MPLLINFRLLSAELIMACTSAGDAGPAVTNECSGLQPMQGSLTCPAQCSSAFITVRRALDTLNAICDKPSQTDSHFKHAFATKRFQTCPYVWCAHGSQGCRCHVVAAGAHSLPHPHWPQSRHVHLRIQFFQFPVCFHNHLTSNYLSMQVGQRCIDALASDATTSQA